MNLTDFDALSFDCYGTLIDWETGLKSGLARIAELSDEPALVEDLLETYGQVEARMESQHPSSLYPDIISRSIVETGAAHGIAVTESLATDIGASVPNWPAFDDSADALALLKQRYRLIILSNVDHVSFAGSNRRLGVTFDAIITAQDVGSYKPDSRNFEALFAQIDEMGIPRDRLLHVAQSLFHDHVPAKAAGIATVWINRRGNTPGHGATPIPHNMPSPNWEFPTMRAFASAVDAER